MQGCAAPTPPTSAPPHSATAVCCVVSSTTETQAVDDINKGVDVMVTSEDLSLIHI